MRIAVLNTLAIIGSLIGYVFIGYCIPREATSLLLSCYGLLFIFYAYLIFQIKSDSFSINWKGLLVLAVLFRLTFLIAIPLLSDDFYRFIWDGHMTVLGFNPYLSLPSNFDVTSTAGSALNPLISGMNSPDYYTVYPPFLQGVFALSAFISSGNLIGSIIAMRLMIIICEIGTILILRKMLFILGLPASRSWLYALNPLVIVELTGNLHPEAFMLFFLALSLYFFLTSRYSVSAIFMALSISAKLIPLLLLPLIMFQLGMKRFLKYLAIVITGVAVLAMPFFDLDILPLFLSSIDLYFRTFEFNASFYYLFRELGEWLTGYNPIQLVGPTMGFLGLLVILFVSRTRKEGSAQNYLNHALIVLTIYFLFATTVHPWYISSLVFFAVLSKRLDYPIVWSALVVLSYVHYQENTFSENYLLIFLEYIVVIVMLIFEYRFQNKFKEEQLKGKY